MVARAFDDCDRARIPDCEALTRDAGEIRLARDRAVKDGVADDDVLVCRAGRGFGRTHRDAAPRQSLADIVVGIARQIERDAVGQPCAEALPGNAGKRDADGFGRQARMAVRFCDPARQHRAGRPVDVANRPFERDRRAVLDRVPAGVDQIVVERGAEAVILRQRVAQGHALGDLGLSKQAR